MATSLAAKAAQNQNLGLLRLSLNYLRSFTATAAVPSPSSSASKKPKRKKKKNLFEVAQFLPSWGIGYHMAKTHWTNVSYEITKINLYKDGRHGKAWGIAYKDEKHALKFAASIENEDDRGFIAKKIARQLYTIWKVL